MITELEVAFEEIVKIVEAIGEVTEAMTEVHVVILEVTIVEDLVIPSEENHAEVLEVNGLVEAVLEAIILRHPVMIVTEETLISILVIAIFVRNVLLKIVVEVAALEATIIMKILEETGIFANLMMIESRGEVHTVMTSLVISIIEPRTEVHTAMTSLVISIIELRAEGHTVRNSLVILTIFVEEEVAGEEVVEATEEQEMTEDRKEVIPVGVSIAEENPEATRHREISTIDLEDVVDLLEVGVDMLHTGVEVDLLHIEGVVGEATLVMTMMLKGRVIGVGHLLMIVIKGIFFLRKILFSGCLSGF